MSTKSSRLVEITGGLCAAAFVYMIVLGIFHTLKPEAWLLWALVKGSNLRYYNRETILSTIDPYYGNLQ